MPGLKADAAAALTRMARESFASFTGASVVETIVSRPWASITSSGKRHVLRLRLEGDGAAAAADAFLDGLAEREFDLCDHILADIVLISDERAHGGAFVRLGLEALTMAAD